MFKFRFKTLKNTHKNYCSSFETFTCFTESMKPIASRIKKSLFQFLYIIILIISDSIFIHLIDYEITSIYYSIIVGDFPLLSL